MKPNAKLIAIELNEDFVEELTNIHDPRLTVIHGNALELSSYVETADYVVSGLPLNVFSKEDHEMMLRQIKKILVHAYIQFHYSPLAERYIKKEFPQVAKKFVAMNIPPAIVYTAKA
jgi:phospholipid N-methyltransferase